MEIKVPMSVSFIGFLVDDAHSSVGDLSTVDLLIVENETELSIKVLRNGEIN